MAKKCPVCGSTAASKGTLCNRCKLDSGRLAGSCTGVKYPCSYHCKKCFFDLLYLSK